MSTSIKFMRGLLWSVPIVAISVFAIFQASAGTTATVIPTGKISTTNMPDYASYPDGSVVGVTTIAPVAMIVESTDEQLFYKAYTDYTDMTNKGSPDITYNNAFEYQGYFNSAVCYNYTGNTFVPAAVATNYTCSGSSQYSGNFMNWVTMSRLDMLRFAMYGGLRTVDTPTKTVITRAIIPNDGHAWVKVYSGTDVSSYLPVAKGTTAVSLCNATTGDLSAATNSSAGLYIASGVFTQWASMASSQCNTNNGDTNAPTSSTPLVVSVQVCDGTYDTRTMCKSYGTAPATISLKPTGVLQQFGQSDSSQPIRFALMSGSRVTPRTGGVLRKNASFIEGNLTSAGIADHTCTTVTNEVNFADGTFCTQTGKNQGVIQNLSEISLNTTNNYWNGGSWNGCSTYGIYNRYPGFSVNGVLDDPGESSKATNYHCGAWGNPVAEMYGEALRYMSGASSATSGFDTSSTDGTGMSQNLTWIPPVTTANYCAACAIVLISSGGITFDGDELPSLTSVLHDDVNSATDLIGTNEGVTGNSYLVGRMLATSTDLAPGSNVNTTSDVCQAQTVTKFSLVRGICPDGASMEGGYLVAGEAWQAWVNGITLANVASPNQIKPVHTYAVALSESIPTFTIPTSAGNVTLAPLCQSSNSTALPAETAAATTYRTCGLLSLQLGQTTSTKSPYYVYGQTFNTAGTTGSFTVVWDDSTWGNDHDLDVISVVSWCVGTACGSTSDTSASPSNFCWNTNVSGAQAAYSTVATATSASCTGGHLKAAIGANQVLVRTETLSAAAGNDLTLGFSVSGVNGSNNGVSGANNGIHRMFYRPGNQNFNLVTTSSSYPTTSTAPQVEIFTAAGSKAGVSLQNPLWYAAKYGGFTYTSAVVGQPSSTTDAVPTLATQWQGTDGTGDPANYFLARDPSALVAGLQNAFQQIASSGNSANNFGNATTPSSSNDANGDGLSYQVQYFMQRYGVSWTGSLQAFWSDSNGYLREGTTSGGDQVLSSTADYIVSGPDTSAGALPNAVTSYRCTIPPVPPAGSTTFDPSASANSSSCSIESATNPLVPTWDATTLLNTYYDPTVTASATIIANMAKQRAYAADASIGATAEGQRYIFTYLTAQPNGSTATGTVTNGTQTDFVWNPSSCSSLLGTGLFATYTLSSTSGFCGSNVSLNILGVTIASGRIGNFGLLNEESNVLSQNLVNWVRGQEDTTDYRSRTNNATTGKNTYRLGDIVNSSPTIVSTPAESYDLLYSDYSYAAFRSNYQNRRQMVYVGANDGMLHAFNSGFYVSGQAATTSGSTTTAATNPTDYRQLPSGLTDGDAAVPQGNNWALGQEAWAFVPQNLLPHLRWMADKNYTHVFYVDGSPVVSDVKIFGTSTSTSCQAGTPASSDIDTKGHVCGWGTVMVVPFRLGGGPISVPMYYDTDTTVADTQVSNSSYVLLDVTDPELPPTVLGEITTGSFALGAPAFAVHREASDGQLHFLLTIGSGPSDNGGPTGTGYKPVAAATGSTLSVYVYDLANILASNSATSSSTPVASFTGTTGGGPANSFASDMIASDFDLNNSAEGVYFGVNTNPPTSTSQPQVFSGSLWKVNMNTGAAAARDTSDPGTWALTQIINNGEPISVRPEVAVDSSNRPMVYFGTGRSYTANDDSGSSAQGIQQEYIVGVSDNSLLTTLPAACQASPTWSSLYNASNTTVTASGTVSSPSGPTTATTIASLQTALTATVTSGSNAGCYQYSGWYDSLAAGTGGNVQQPSERVVSGQTLLGNILLTPTYIPPSAAQIIAAGSSACNPVPVPGTSNLYGLNYITGTTDTTLASSFGLSSGFISKSVSLGTGKASSPVLHVNSNGMVSAAFGISGGTKLVPVPPLPAKSNGEISWREPVDNQ
jgi:type IV pilus assembly protein PilY1